MPQPPLLCEEGNALQLNFVCLSKIIWDTTLGPIETVEQIKKESNHDKNRKNNESDGKG